MHGWDKVSPIDKGQHDIVPISTKSVDKLQQLKGPMEGCSYRPQASRKGNGFWLLTGPG